MYAYWQKISHLYVIYKKNHIILINKEGNFSYCSIKHVTTLLSPFHCVNTHTPEVELCDLHIDLQFKV